MNINPDLLVALLFLTTCMVVIYFVGVYKINKEANNPPDTGTWVNFFDEYKNMMEALTQTSLQYADSYLGRHLIYNYLDHKSSVNGRKIDCCSVKIKFMMKTYKNGRREVHADTESHYGNAEFYNGEVHQNYYIAGKSFVADVNDFPKLWHELLEYHFSVKLDGVTDKIKLV